MEHLIKTNIGITDTMRGDLLALGRRLHLGAPGGRLGAAIRFCCASFLQGDRISTPQPPSEPPDDCPSPLMVACGAEGPSAAARLRWPPGLCATVQGRFDSPEDPGEAYADRFSRAVEAGAEWLEAFGTGGYDVDYQDVDRALGGLLPSATAAEGGAA